MQGQQIGPYKLMNLLGQGGQSVVWRALDVRSSRTVALKVLRPGLAGPADVARLKREAALLASLSDPGLPRGHELYEDGQLTPSLAMEFIEGTTLSSLLTSRRLGRVDMLVMGRELARIVSVLHGHGLAHRDIKPSNIMLRAGWQQGQMGSIVLVDLGIARGTRRHATSYTDTGVVIGTPVFMSPEALVGSVRDEQAAAGDIFALGVLIWSVLTGRHPTGLPMSASWEDLRSFYSQRSGITLDPAMSAHLDTAVPGMSSVVLRCVEPSLHARFSSASQLLAALSSLQAARAPQTAASPVSTGRGSGDWTGTAESSRPALLPVPAVQGDLSRIAPTAPKASSSRSGRPAKDPAPAKALIFIGTVLKLTGLALILLPVLLLVLVGISRLLKPAMVTSSSQVATPYSPPEERRATVAIPPRFPYGVLRDGPSYGAQDIGHFPQGAPLSVLSAEAIDGWLQVRTGSGMVGYMHLDIVRFR